MRKIINQTCGLNNVLQDKDLFFSMLKLFVQEHAGDEKELTLASSTGDIVALFHTNHTLKGVSASLGFERLYDSCYQLDKQIKKDESIDSLTNKSLVITSTPAKESPVYNNLTDDVINNLNELVNYINQTLSIAK